MNCDCVPAPALTSSSVMRLLGRDSYCHNRIVSSHTALDYCPQPLSSGEVVGHFCVYCHKDYLCRMLCEMEMVNEAQHRMKGVESMQQDDQQHFGYIFHLNTYL